MSKEIQNTKIQDTINSLKGFGIRLISHNKPETNTQSIIDPLNDLAKDLIRHNKKEPYVYNTYRRIYDDNYSPDLNILTRIFKNTENGKYLIINTDTNNKIVDFLVFEQLKSRYICFLIPHQVRGSGLSFSLDNKSVLRSQEITLQYANDNLEIYTNDSPKKIVSEQDNTIPNIEKEITANKWKNIAKKTI